MIWMYLGYLVALGLTTAAVEVIVHSLRGAPTYFYGWSGFLPCCSLVLGGEFWLLVVLLPSEQRQWKEILRRAGKPAWYGVAAGIACGAAVGVCCGLLSLVDGLDEGIPALVLSLLGPIPAVAWVYHLKSDPVQADYDDEMRTYSPDHPLTIEFPDIGATIEFGRRLGKLLFPNAVVAMIGTLGAGKTHLVRAVAEGLGIVNAAAVTSPTFTLIHEYPARLPIFHFDAYRLSGPDAFLDLGATEYYQAGGVCLIEWADRAEAALPDEKLTIRLTHLSDTGRRAELAASGAAYVRLLDDLRTRNGGPD